MKVKIPKVEGSGFISLDKVREMLKTSQEDDVVNQPSHYLFPGGVETIHLSRHLSSNGGQAVQYIARATRMDGRVKGSPVEDLKKAIVFIQDEIERMKG